MDINHFEIGSKGRYLDNRLSITGDLFYTIYDDYQIETFSNIPNLENPPLILANAPQAETHGAELSGVFRPTADTTINLSAAYIDAKFVNYKFGQCWFGTGSTAGTSCYTNSNGSLAQNVSGKPLPNSPKFKFTLNGEQLFPIDAIDSNLVASATYTYRSSAQMLPDEGPYSTQGAFGLLDLDLGLQSYDGRYEATVFVNNVTNKVYYTDVEDFWNTVWSAPNGHNSTIVGEPGRDAKRFAGLRLTAKF
jgi:iron complex outermembrane receptor protein